MSTEICKKCQKDCTPWYYVEILEGHICNDCYHEVIEEIEQAKKEIKMESKEIERLIRINERLNLVLGYATAIIIRLYEDEGKRKDDPYNWIMESIDNLIYLDKPLPRIT